jgi:ABC-type Zn uptake system ZnuABC Zn-binding protein ZnuA/ABC-type Mn2+/Zn2+ transport system permease subunit
MLDVFQLPFAQRGLVVLLLLAVAGGLLGTWIVLRGLAFYSHAVGTAAFPGLVLADGLGFAAALGAAGAAGVLAVGVWLVTRARRTSTDSATAIVLVGLLALGVVLASDVFESGANIETLLFGSLLVIDDGDIAIAGAAAAIALLLTIGLGPRWLARGFDPSLPHSSRVPDAALFGAVAFAAIAALSLVGALLATALLVVPAATTRLWFDRLLPWQIGTVALTAVEGVVGIWLSVETNAPPGATIAVLGGGVFVVSVLGRLVRRRPALVAAAALAALAVAGCGSSSSGSTDGKLDVIATTPIVADYVREVGGDRVHVTQLLHPNTDPHEYEPRPSDVRDTAQAKLVFANGLDLDHWIGDVVKRSGGDAEVVDLGAAVPTKRPDDPHWFHDPTNARAAVDGIAAALAKADSASADAYRSAARRYNARLDVLDGVIKDCIRSVPGPDQKLVTDHDAFGYFTDRYGIRVVGAVIPSLTTQAQPSARDTANLVRVIEREHVKAIFPEESLNPRLAQTIAQATGASAEYHLYGDTLGAKGSPGATYIGMELANVDAMVQGFLGGEHGCKPVKAP